MRTYYQDDSATILCGSSLSLNIEPVQCVVTSPPYWGLRKYDGEQSMIWGGDPDCEHEWGHSLPAHHKGQVRDNKAVTFENAIGQNAEAGSYCLLCGAWRGAYGLEPTPEMYVYHTVLFLRAIRDVLKDDGCCFFNVGDSYASGKGSCFNPGGGENSLGQGRKAEGAHPLDRGNVSELHAVGLKPKDLVLIPFRVALAAQADGWWVRSDIIWTKCLSGGTRLYAKTQKGEMPAMLKDLVRLKPKTVQLWDGKKWNQVVEWGEVVPSTRRTKFSSLRRSAKYRGTKVPPVGGDIEIEFRNGERIGCTRNHKWPTQRGDVCASDLRIGDVIAWTPLPEPARPIIPSNLADKDTGWFVGMYLAEGSQSNGTLQFSGHLQETARHERLRQIAESFHGTCAVHQTTNNGSTANINGPILKALVDTYISGKIAKNKHLHPRCWARSNDFLANLLQGYIEGDGYQRENGSWRLGYCNNDQLTADLRTLAARLGMSVHLRRGISVNTTTGKRHKCWRGDIVTRADHRRIPDGEVMAIRQSRARKFWNVTLTDEPHSFALASGICTKNSNPMPESVTDRPTNSHEHIFLFTKNAKYYWDQDAVKEEAIHEGRIVKASLAGAQNTESRGTGDAPNGAMRTAWGFSQHDTLVHGRNLRDVWTIATQPSGFKHYAAFPLELPTRCIKAATRPGDTVLDPFCGTGRTLEAALKLGRKAVGVDISEAYCEMSRQRLEKMEKAK